MREAEIHSISKKYGSFRLRDKVREKYLLQSILEHGVREPLQCVRGEEEQYPYVLLDGLCAFGKRAWKGRRERVA